MQIFPLTKQLSLPPNFTFHSATNSPTGRRLKSKIHTSLFFKINIYFSLVKPIEVVKGTSLSSVVGSTSRFLTLQIEKASNSSPNDNRFPLHLYTSTEILNRPISPVTPRRSNTIPSRQRKSPSITTSNQQTTHLSPTCKRNPNTQQNATASSSSQPFSPSLLSTQPKRRIRVIDDGDDGDSISSSLVIREDRQEI